MFASVFVCAVSHIMQPLDRPTCGKMRVTKGKLYFNIILKMVLIS